MPTPLALRALAAAALALAAAADAQVYAGSGADVGPPSAVTGLPPGFADAVFLSGLAAPMSMTFARDGRLFICEKAGAVRIVTPAGALLPTPFVQLSPSLGQDSQGRMGDGGLFSVALDPADPADTYLYVQWLHAGDNGPGKPWVGDFSRVSRFTVDPSNPNVALPGSEFVVFDHSTLVPGTVFHFGGSLVFGRDGLLYSAHGDYYGVEPQTITSSLGKVSRFYKNGTIPSWCHARACWSVPLRRPLTSLLSPRAADGPFYATGAAQGKAIFALGLRNPFATLVAPAVLDGLPKAGVADGALLVFDVGEDSWEEINAVASPGANGGWPSDEGFAASSGRNSVNNAATPLPAGARGRYLDPLFAWAHDAQAELAPGLPASCCTTGGALYDGVSFPQTWLGALLYTDLCGGYIAFIPPASAGPRPTPRLFARGYNTPHGLVTGPLDGALYLFSHNDGTVHRIVYAPLAAPVLAKQPASARVPLGVVASFSVSVSSAAAVAYQWQRSPPGSAAFVNIAGATGASFSPAPATLADDGARYRVSATTANGYIMSAPALLRVMNNLPPRAAIVAPAALEMPGLAYSNMSFGSYVANETFVFVGSGLDFTDARLGPTQIPAANFSWNIYMRHNTHRHDFAIGVPGANLTFTTPLEGELSAHQAFEVDLFATDAGGSMATATAIIYPILGSLLLSSSSGGGTVLVNGVPLPLPSVFTTIAGQGIALAPGPDLVGAFAAWSDDATARASRTVTVVPGNLSLTIVLQAASASASPSPSSSSSPPSASDSQTAAPGGEASQFAGRASSGATAAQQAGPWGLLARLALAVFAAEAVRRMQA